MGVALRKASFLIGGMAVSAFGLWLYTKAKGGPWYLVLTAIVPVLGPLLGLAIYERKERMPSASFLGARRRLTRWGLGLGVLGVALVLAVGLLELPCKAEAVLNGTGIIIAVLGGLMVILLRPALLAALLALGILAAIRVPSFLSYQSRARRSEAKAQLERLFDAATSRKAAHGTYEISEISQLGLVPQDQAWRYSLWFPVNGVPTRISFLTGTRCDPCLDTPPSSVNVTASATGFTAVAKGNIDSDTTCDEWSINDARELKNTLNDLAQ